MEQTNLDAPLSETDQVGDDRIGLAPTTTACGGTSGGASGGGGGGEHGFEVGGGDVQTGFGFEHSAEDHSLKMFFVNDQFNG